RSPTRTGIPLTTLLLPSPSGSTETTTASSLSEPEAAPAVRPLAHSRQLLCISSGRGWMKVKQPDFAAVTSLVWRQVPALLVPRFRHPLARRRRLQLPACDDVLPSGRLDTLWWRTCASLLAVHHRFSPHPSSKRSGLSISAR